ncbi:MAG TPA: AMP-binding protein [Candidatus Nanopelagicales bacterium]|nr:AMP-binding protein [Candidatus Nanopelagicales bacterium]
MGSYLEQYQRSLDDPEAFWLDAARLINWVHAPTQALDSTRDPLFRWYPDATMNTCFNALDRHVIAGRGDQVAIFYDSPVTGTTQQWTYAQLLEATANFAGALLGLGVQRGDRVVIYLPMIPQAVIAMLACARIGAVHSVVFGGFASAELSARIDDAKPTVIVTASCGIEPTRIVEYKPLVDAALEMSEHEVNRVVVFQRPQAPATLGPGDIDWESSLIGAAPVEPITLAATDPLYILYTSGTTGKPKGIVRDNGGHAVAMAWSFRNVYGMQAGDVWWSASDVGWVVGHSYIVYAPLISGATTVLYEGKPVGTPDAAAFWRVIEQYSVRSMFTAPTAIRAIKKEDPEGALLAEHDVSSLSSFFFAGERLDPDTYEWARRHLSVPIIDNWWQTETGWPIAANLRGLEPMPIKPGSPSVPVPGYDIRILDPASREVPAGAEGDIAIKLPLPPGTLPTLWGDDDRYIASYLSDHPGYYTSGDGGYVDEDGYLYVMGRTDDVINVAGHRLSTGSMEAVVAAHPAVAECAVIGVHDDLKGQIPRAFTVLKAGAQISAEELQAQVVQAVREEIGPVAALREVVIVPALPKTRSGKILRRTMRGIAAGRDEPVPSTIEDPAVLDALVDVLRQEA